MAFAGKQANTNVDNAYSVLGHGILLNMLPKWLDKSYYYAVRQLWPRPRENAHLMKDLL